MIRKKVINKERIRCISGGFSFLPHRFLTDGFLDSLNQKQLLLYFFLVLVSDRHGMSFYAYDAICSYLSLTLDDYIEARNALIKKDLIAFDGSLFQVLALPSKPVWEEDPKQDPVTVSQLIRRSLQEASHAR